MTARPVPQEPKYTRQQEACQHQYDTTVLQIHSMLAQYVHPDQRVHPESHGEIRSQILSMLSGAIAKTQEATKYLGGKDSALLARHIGIAAEQCLSSGLPFREKLLLVYCAAQEMSEIYLFDELENG